MATFDEDEDEKLFYHQLVKPPAIYSSNTWSNKSKIRNEIQRPPLVKHASVEYRENHNSSSENNQDQTCQDLSILDLQTLRRDSKVKNSPGSKSNIRLPQQDVFKVHKPGFHISSERVWFPRTNDDEKTYDEEQFELQNNSEESTTLADEEVEIKLPCRSVSINVVGMPSDNDEVNARPSPCHNDFQETIQRGCQQPLLLTSTILPPPPPNHETELSFSQFPTAINGERSTLLVTTSSHSHHHDIECSSSKRFEVEKLSSCCRYRKPAIVSLFSVGLILIITFLVLYWNYHETVHRRMTKKKGYILDHWGKGSPSAAETAVLDLEVEILKEQERQSQRAQEQQESQRAQEGQTEPPLVFDDRVFYEDLDHTVPDKSIRTTSMAPSRLDSRVD